MFQDLLKYIFEETYLKKLYFVDAKDGLLQFYVELDVEKFHPFWGRIEDEFEVDKILVTLDFNRKEISLFVNGRSERVFPLDTIQKNFKECWLFDSDKVYGPVEKKMYYMC